MGDELEARLLRSFVAATRAGSLSRAATVLGLTQPALSQQVRRLEAVVGSPLLRRSATGVSVTRAGEELLPYAERILALSEQALAETGRSLTGQCGVGLLEDLAVSQLPQALSDIARMHPLASLEVLTLPKGPMREAFDTGRLKLVLDEVLYLPEPPRWTVRRPLAWAVGTGVDVSADPLPLILFSDTCTWRTSMLESLTRAGRSWRVAYESNTIAGLLAALRAGLGVTALMPTNVDPAMAVLDTGVLPELSDVELGLARHPRTLGDPLVDAIEGVLRRGT